MTEERKIQLIAEVDATGTRAGFNEIQRQAGTMAASVQRSSQQAERAVGGVGNGAGASARSVEAAQRNLIGSIQRTTATMEAGSRSGSAYYEVLARQRGVDPAVLAPYLAQLRALEAAQLRANQAGAAGSQTLNRVGASAAQTANALRGVPAQFTDIITSLQGGQAPLTVLFQQGGQLRDMFGSAGGAARALGGYVLGMVNPFTLAAAATVGLAVAHHQGAKESEAYARALILSGNTSGATINQLADISRTIGVLSGSQAVAAEAVTAIAATGKVSVENMQRFAAVAVGVQRVIGRSVADTAADFADLGKSPLTALDKINEKYHFITASTYAQVKALQDQGRAAEAANVAQNAYADGIDKQRQKVLDSLTDWERGWIRIKNAASGAADAAIDIALGRQATNVQKITGLLAERELIEKRIGVAIKNNDGVKEAQFRADLANNEVQINGLRTKDATQKAAAKSEKDAAVAAEAKNKWLADGDRYLTRAAQLERDITKARNEGATANLDAAAIEKRVSDIRKTYADIYNDGIDSNIATLKRRSAVEDLLSKRATDNVGFERAAGMITEEQALERITALELAQFDNQRKGLVEQLGLIKQKQNSLKDQKEKQGEIDALDITRGNRVKQGEDDPFLLEQKRSRLAVENYANTIDQASAVRDGLVEQVKSQRDYNETIGLTATELTTLNAVRAEEQALRKDEEASIAEGLDLSGKLAVSYREQARAIRDRSAAEKEGFVKQRDPWVSLRSSVKKYGDEASNVGAQISDAMTNAFKSAEDAFVGFVTTGKVSFSSLAVSILSDIARIQARKAIAGFVDMAVGAFTGGSSTPALSGARAAGGPVTGGLSYLVGEKGPEIFTPSGSGAIIPNNRLGAGGGDINISTNVNVSAGGASSETAGDQSAAGRALADMISVKVKEVLVRETRQGGILWNQQMRGAG